MPPSEKAIQEENRKLLARMQGKDRDGEAPGFTYDLEGRIVVMKKAAPNKLVTEGYILIYFSQSFSLHTDQIFL